MHDCTVSFLYQHIKINSLAEPSKNILVEEKMPNWSIQPSYANVGAQKISYVVPMTAAASVATTLAMENNAAEMSKNSIATALENIENKVSEALNTTRQGLLMAQDRAETVTNSIAFGGMSLWFLVAAAIVLIVLFSRKR
jgi:hypothetical protein